MVDITAFPIETIRIDALATTLSPSLDHEVAAMKDGLSVKLTIAQILSLVAGSGVDAAGIDFTPAAGIGASNVQAAIEEVVADVAAALTGKVATSRTIGVAGLATGGGSLAADRTITVPKASEATGAAGTNDTDAMTAKSTKAAIIAIATGAPLFVLEDQKSSGTGGGTTAAGWTNHAINTEVRDPLGVVSIGSDQFVTTVDCWVKCRFVGFKTGLIPRLWNVTDGVEIARGMTSRGDSSPNTGDQAFVEGPVTAGKTIAVQYYDLQGGGVTSGLGAANSQGTEKYLVLEGSRI